MLTYKSAVVLTIANVLGAVVIISVLEPYFRKCTSSFAVYHCLLTSSSVIAVGCLAFGYRYFAAFYRESAREIKRLGEYRKMNNCASSLIAA